MKRRNLWKYTDLQRGKILGLLKAEKEVKLMLADANPASESWELLAQLQVRLFELIGELDP